MAKPAQSSVLIMIAIICGLLLTGIAILLYLGRDVVLDNEPLAPMTSAAPVQALDQSAEERAYEAMRTVQLPRETAERTEETDGKAAEPTPPRLQAPGRRAQEAKHGSLPPTTLALNCERLRRAYSAEELKKVPGFQEKCKQ